MLVGLDMSMEEAVSQARSRLQDIDSWALSDGDTADVDLSRFDYLVRGWKIDAIYLFRRRSPARDPEQPITIGRGQHCDVCIPEEWISKVHAAAIRDDDPRERDVSGVEHGGWRTLWQQAHMGDHYYITDIESHHGVLINGERVPAGKMRHLGPYDIVTLGLTTLLFVDAYMQRLLVQGA